MPQQRPFVSFLLHLLRAALQLFYVFLSKWAWHFPHSCLFSLWNKNDGPRIESKQRDEINKVLRMLSSVSSRTANNTPDEIILGSIRNIHVASLRWAQCQKDQTINSVLLSHIILVHLRLCWWTQLNWIEIRYGIFLSCDAKNSSIQYLDTIVFFTVGEQSNNIIQR